MGFPALTIDINPLLEMSKDLSKWQATPFPFPTDFRAKIENPQEDIRKAVLDSVVVAPARHWNLSSHILPFALKSDCLWKRKMGPEKLKQGLKKDTIKCCPTPIVDDNSKWIRERCDKCDGRALGY